MSNLNILVIDDSTDFTSGIKRLLESMGNTATVCTDPEESKSMLNQDKYDLVLVDCFMPTTDGFILSAELHEVIQRNNMGAKIILMSGILVDEASKKEAHSHPHIKDFLIKPISKKDFEDCFSKHFEQTKVSILTELLSQNPTESDLSNILAVTAHLDGLDLSYVIPLIAELELSCKLNLIDSETDNTYSISFVSGFLSSIFSSEYNNSLGELLVGLGYLTREDLSSYVNSDEFKTSKIPIGKALTELNLISPHAVPVALKQQNINRLSDILRLDNMKIELELSSNNNSGNNNDNSSNLNQYEIHKECRLWIENNASDTNAASLKSTLSGFSFQKSPTLLETDPDSERLTELLSYDMGKYSNDEIIFLFSNLIGRKLQLAEDSDASSAVEKKSLLDKISSLKFRIRQNNPYKLLGVDTDNMSDQKISKKYQVYAKELHPDKLINILSPEELHEAQEVFSEITKAFNLIKTEDNRKTFESFKRNKSTQIKLQCNNNLEASKTLLLKGEYSKALCILNTSEMHEHYPNEFGLYFLWAALKSKENTDVSDQLNTLLEREHRNLNNEALYYYIKSLEALRNENLESFQQFINKSLQANAQFLPARREIQIVKNQLANEKQKNNKSWFSFKKSS